MANSPELHSLLRRQLRRASLDRIDPATPVAPMEFQALLESVSRAYEQADADRRMLERSIEISSRELGESNRDLRLAKEAAEQAAQAKGEFLANMSHEIRTPMNAVVGLTELLLESPLNGEQREFLQTIRTASQSLLEILNDILDFSRIDNHKVELEEIPFSLRGCLEASVDLFAARAGAGGVELIASVDPRIPDSIVGDANRLRQILINLIGNAVKFTADGEIEVSVWPGARVNEDVHQELEFRVRDTGIGIPADRMDRLFKFFSQVDCSTTRRYGGTGLGLAISWRLSELMGGRMWAESEAGKGSTFHFTVEVRPGPSESAPRPLEGRRVRIATVSRALEAALSRQLEHLGAIVVDSDGRGYEILISDVALIGVSGVDGDPLRVVLSAPGQRRPELPGDWASARFLAKPVKGASLVEALVGERLADATAGDSPFDPAVLPRLRILVAEDNQVNQRIILALLRRFGLAVDLAANGREALQAIESRNYDLVLMDMHMPEMDGLEATREIRRRWAPESQPKIVALTASAMLDDRIRCEEAGMDGYLSKPVRLEDLKALLLAMGSPAAARETTIVGR